MVIFTGFYPAIVIAFLHAVFIFLPLSKFALFSRVFILLVGVSYRWLSSARISALSIAGSPPS